MKKIITAILLVLMMSLHGALSFSSFVAEAEVVDSSIKKKSTFITPSNQITNKSNSEPENEQTAFQDEIDQIILNLLENTEDDSVSFGFITDLHCDESEVLSKNSIQRQLSAMVQIANQTSLDFIVLGGDLYSGNVFKDSKQGVKDLLTKLLEPLINCKKPVFILKGNHDDNSYYNVYDPAMPLADEKILNNEEYHSLTNAKFKGLINYTDNYFYYDLNEKNTRIICLNSSDYPLIINKKGTRIYAGSNFYGYSEKQLKWLVNTALSDRNKKYIIFSHIGTDLFTVNGRDELNLIMKSLNEGTIYTGVGTSRDFSGYQGLDLFCFGHMHADKISKSDKIGDAIAISTGSAIIDNNPVNEEESAKGYDRVLGRTYGDYSECLFDIIIIKIDEVKCLRFGAGEDRSISKDSSQQEKESTVNGWKKENGIWFFYKAGEKKTGWIQVGSSWYYLDANVEGAMRVGWLQQDNTWYYLSDSGAMVTGMYSIDEKVSSFDTSGAWLGYQ